MSIIFLTSVSSVDTEKKSQKCNRSINTMDANHLVEITSRKFLLKISNNSCDRKRQCSTGHNNLEKLSISLYLN